MLSFYGRVAWRPGIRTCLAFAHRTPGHDLLAQGALGQLLGPSTPAATPDDRAGPALPSTATGRA